MSKSFGNTIDPHKCLDMVPSDTFRYYLIRETYMVPTCHFRKIQ